MKIIVGLGNPGGEYQDTRHNIGFMTIEKLAKELTTESVVWKEDKKFNALVAKIGEVLLVKPITLMNSSGVAVSSIMRYYKLTPADVWVIHDDIDLPIGKIRIRQKGSSAGHRGVDSIITELKTDAFVRFRLGIGRGKLFSKGDSDTSDIEKGNAGKAKRQRHQWDISFVLSRFTQGEAGTLKHLIKNGTEAVRIALTEGLDKAMVRFN
ncbi:MAG: aminoacyl-tRNA hydrolase [Candidatus Gottesmanbacteria bacterium]